MVDISLIHETDMSAIDLKGNVWEGLVCVIYRNFVSDAESFLAIYFQLMCYMYTDAISYF